MGWIAGTSLDKPGNGDRIGRHSLPLGLHRAPVRMLRTPGDS
jgi:hypothetical protein